MLLLFTTYIHLIYPTSIFQKYSNLCSNSQFTPPNPNINRFSPSFNHITTSNLFCKDNFMDAFNRSLLMQRENEKVKPCQNAEYTIEKVPLCSIKVNKNQECDNGYDSLFYGGLAGYNTTSRYLTGNLFMEYTNKISHLRKNNDEDKNRNQGGHSKLYHENISKLMKLLQKEL